MASDELENYRMQLNLFRWKQINITFVFIVFILSYFIYYRMTQSFKQRDSSLHLASMANRLIMKSINLGLKREWMTFLIGKTELSAFFAIVFIHIWISYSIFLRRFVILYIRSVWFPEDAEFNEIHECLKLTFGDL